MRPYYLRKQRLTRFAWTFFAVATVLAAAATFIGIAGSSTLSTAVAATAGVLALAAAVAAIVTGLLNLAEG